MRLTNNLTEYGFISKAFHWLSAAALVVQIPLGCYLVDLDFNETRSADADCIDFCMWTNVKYTSRYLPKYSDKKWLDQQ